MPKFLDVPTWYGPDGKKTYAQEVIEVTAGGTAYNFDITTRLGGGRVVFVPEPIAYSLSSGKSIQIKLTLSTLYPAIYILAGTAGNGTVYPITLSWVTCSLGSDGVQTSFNIWGVHSSSTVGGLGRITWSSNVTLGGTNEYSCVTGRGNVATLTQYVISAGE